MNFAALLFFGLCWGSTVPLTKFAISAGYNPLGMIVWQLGVSAAVLGLVLLFRRMSIRIQRQHLVYLLIIAFIGTLIPNTLSLLATRHLPAGIIALVLATVPIASLSIALLCRIESFSLRRVLGVGLGVLSLVLIGVPDTTLPDPSKAKWLLVAVLAPLCYAIEGNYVAARAPSKLTAIGTLFGASVCGLLILMPVVYFNNWQVSIWVPWDATRWAIVAAAFGHVVAYSGYLWLLGRAGAVFTSQVAYVVTLTGVLGAMIFLGERYGWVLFVAVALMLMALALVKPVRTSRSVLPHES